MHTTLVVTIGISFFGQWLQRGQAGDTAPEVRHCSPYVSSAPAKRQLREWFAASCRVRCYDSAPRMPAMAGGRSIFRSRAVHGADRLRRQNGFAR